MTQIIYAAMFTDCIYESALSPISLHSTHSGAVKAIEAHRNKHRDEYTGRLDGLDEDMKRQLEEWAKKHPWSPDSGDGFCRWEVMAFEVDPSNTPAKEAA